MKKRLCLLSLNAGLFFCSTALAQTAGGDSPSDFPAPAVTFPQAAGGAGGGDSASGGQEAPTSPSTSSSGGEAAGGKGGADTPGDFIVGESDASLYGEEGKMTRSKIPETHVVKKGDTLWKLCDTYYGDPWAWPQLWAYNKTITNPHWIYPGEEIKLMAGPGQRAAAAGEPTKAGPETVTVAGGRVYSDRDVDFVQNAFIENADKAQGGAIAGSREEKILLGAGDEIYLRGSKDFKPQPGQNLNIYRVRRQITDQEGKELGSLVEILGVAKIKKAKENQATVAEITESLNYITRDDIVGPVHKRLRRVPVQVANQNVKGSVIDALAAKEMQGNSDIVFIDKGTKNGVSEGNRFLVVHRGDGLQRLKAGDNDSNNFYPQEAVAEVLVIDSRDHASVGIITMSKKEVRKGDTLIMRRGY